MFVVSYSESKRGLVREREELNLIDFREEQVPRSGCCVNSMTQSL